jgi:hypothetical protein
MSGARRKPRIRLGGAQQADAFSVPYRVRDALRKAGCHAEADEFLDRVERCRSLERMLMVAGEYVQIIQPAAPPAPVDPVPMPDEVPPPVSGLLARALSDVEFATHDRELLRIIAFALREAGERVLSLAQAARAAAVRERQLALARELSRHADLVEDPDS